MESVTYIKDTQMLILFGLLFTTIFGFWLIKRITKHNRDFRNKSTLYFLWNNYELFGGLLLGIVLLIFAIFF